MDKLASTLNKTTQIVSLPAAVMCVCSLISVANINLIQACLLSNQNMTSRYNKEVKKLHWEVVLTVVF